MVYCKNLMNKMYRESILIQRSQRKLYSCYIAQFSQKLQNKSHILCTENTVSFNHAKL